MMSKLIIVGAGLALIAGVIATIDPNCGNEAPQARLETETL